MFSMSMPKNQTEWQEAANFAAATLRLQVFIDLGEFELEPGRSLNLTRARWLLTAARRRGITPRRNALRHVVRELIALEQSNQLKSGATP